MIAGRFATFCFLRLDREHGVVRYANAGHNPPLLARADGSLERLTVGGTVLGVFADADYARASSHCAGRSPAPLHRWHHRSAQRCRRRVRRRSTRGVARRGTPPRCARPAPARARRGHSVRRRSRLSRRCDDAGCSGCVNGGGFAAEGRATRGRRWAPPAERDLRSKGRRPWPSGEAGRPRSGPRRPQAAALRAKRGHRRAQRAAYLNRISSKNLSARGSFVWPSQNIACFLTAGLALVRAT